MPPKPTDAEIAQFANAVQAHFGPCSCHGTPFGQHTCPGHSFLMEEDRRSHTIVRWERLLFVKRTLEDWAAGEGLDQMAHNLTSLPRYQAPEKPSPEKLEILPW